MVRCWVVAVLRCRCWVRALLRLKALVLAVEIWGSGGERTRHSTASERYDFQAHFGSLESGGCSLVVGVGGEGCRCSVAGGFGAGDVYVGG